MQQRRDRGLGGLLLSAALLPTAQAHHSLVAEFDVNQDIELRGTVTELEWLNPHIWLHLDVGAEDGSVVNWRCELGSPRELHQAGWTKDDLPLGTLIRAHVNPARDGSPACSTRDVRLDDGTRIFSRFNYR